MGNKARNAGKKQSKICYAPATSKSIKFTGKGKCKFYKFEDTPIGREKLEDHIRLEEKKQKRPMTASIDYNNLFFINDYFNNV